VTTVDQGGGRAPRLVNVGLGGLAFRSHSAFRPAHVVKVRIAHVRPAFETTARVAWCRASEGEYELGLAFIEPDDAYRARMVEQVAATSFTTARKSTRPRGAKHQRSRGVDRRKGPPFPDRPAT
jgi:hypothetical protein